MSTDNPYQSPAVEPNDYNLLYREEMAMLQAELGPREPVSVVDILFSFQGRMGRLGYWIFQIGAMVAYFMTLVAVAMVAAPQIDALDELSRLVVIWTIYLPFGICRMAVEVKRWHDRGKSGWWWLINFLPVIGKLWAFIECGFLPGDYGPNAYGEYPSI